jgi:hypothetical protein
MLINWRKIIANAITCTRLPKNNRLLYGPISRWCNMPSKIFS